MLVWVAFGKLPLLVSNSNVSLFWRQVVEKVMGDKYREMTLRLACWWRGT